MKKKIETVQDEIIIDSRDVDRAIELALKRNAKKTNHQGEHAEVISEEILVETPVSGKKS